jgi:hypothetical protein
MEILPALDDSIEPSGDFAARFYARLEERRSGNPVPERLPASGVKQSRVSRWTRFLAAAAMLIAAFAAGLFLRQYEYRTPDTAEVIDGFDVTENLPLLEDMALISDLEFFENLDAIENMPELN